MKCEYVITLFHLFVEVYMAKMTLLSTYIRNTCCDCLGFYCCSNGQINRQSFRVFCRLLQITQSHWFLDMTYLFIHFVCLAFCMVGPWHTIFTIKKRGDNVALVDLR